MGKFYKSSSLGIVNDIVVQEKRLKEINKNRLYTYLYTQGYAWFKGDNKLEDATDCVVIDGKTMQKKDIVNFRRGYEAGIRALGFEYGYKNVNMLLIPEEYQENSFFLEGYREGIISYNKNNNSKKR